MAARSGDRQALFSLGTPGKLAFAAFAVHDAAELDALIARLDAAACDHQEFETPFFEVALAVLDPDGNRFVFGVPKPSAIAPDLVAPMAARLQHIVTASPNAAQVARFFVDALGFTLSDEVFDSEESLRTSFLRCSEEHHSFAVFQAEKSRLDHHCYETSDWLAIRDWGDHLAAQRVPIKWGPGRHGPGNNLFLFFHDADGNWVELSTELEIVAHDRPVGRWPHEERTLNIWGQGYLRS